MNSFGTGEAESSATGLCQRTLASIHGGLKDWLMAGIVETQCDAGMKAKLIFLQFTFRHCGFRGQLARLSHEAERDDRLAVFES